MRDRMNAGRHFGEPSQWKGQLAYSAVSLSFYDRAPDFDLKALDDQMTTRYAMYPPMVQAHDDASFGHSNGYSAIDDTCAWSKAIALDLPTRFVAEGVRNPATARSYPKLVLDQGGSEDANDLVQHFPGRPSKLEAGQRRLQGR